MKYLISIFAVLLIMSCSHNAITIGDGDQLISGLWGGYIIEADGMIFSTIVGIRTIGHPVELVGHGWKWFIWSPGYGEPVERIK